MYIQCLHSGVHERLKPSDFQALKNTQKHVFTKHQPHKHIKTRVFERKVTLAAPSPQQCKTPKQMCFHMPVRLGDFGPSSENT